jgi:hypothetical protein
MVISVQVKVDEVKYTDFRIACLKNRQNVTQAINELIQYYIDNPIKTKEDDKK